MPRLGVNIDHVATLRQVRQSFYPNLLEAALIAEKAGADQITCHLREDRRHIQDQDVFLLRQKITTRLNLEMAATHEMLNIALQIQPDLVTLVPERREELTTEGGLKLTDHFSSIQSIANQLQSQKIPVSLFIDPEENAVRLASQMGVFGIELHTGDYAHAEGNAIQPAFNRLQKATTIGVSLKLKIFAGHGLTLDNLSMLAQIKKIEEYNIGHSIVCRALFVGFEQAVREIKAILNCH